MKIPIKYEVKNGIIGMMSYVFSLLVQRIVWDDKITQV
jgi:hypothetical protein